VDGGGDTALRWLSTLAWVSILGIALGITGCEASGETEEVTRSASPSPPSVRTALDEPCPEGVTIGLGAPFLGRDFAKFSTTGGTVYVSVGQFRRGASEQAGNGRSTVYLGARARPPTYDPHARRLRGTLTTAVVTEDTWSAIDLTEGRYWLTVADGWDVVIRSCEPDGITSR